MKITVIKKTSGKNKTLGGCPFLIDEPPVAKNQSRLVLSDIAFHTGARVMKITVIKKTSGKNKILGGCPYLIDEPPVAKN